MDYKYKIGDRVVVTCIDDVLYLADATYEVGSKGTIVLQETWENKPTYGIDFDDLQASGEDGFWWAKEHWLKPAKVLITCD